jgi:hypothetical protein
MEKLMKNLTEFSGTTLALVALLLFVGSAQARDEVRIDGSSDKAVEGSYARMLGSLKGNQQIELGTAIIQLNLVGISSAREMLADPALRNPGPVRIKDRIAGLTAAEIIALAKKTATTRIVTPGLEPGVPGDLLTPLDAGIPSYALASTRWHFVSNSNGFTYEQTLEFESGGKLVTDPSSRAGVSTWEQSADQVRIFINDRYAVSRGKFADADHLEGTGGNKMGTTWTWTAERR